MLLIFFFKNMQNCETLFNKNHTKKSELSCRKMLTGPLLKIGCFLLENIRDCFPPPLKTLQKHRSGPSLEANIYKIAALRANGIPAALNTFPNWGNANSPHFWTEIIGDEHIEKLYDNTQRPYISDSDILVDNIFWKKHLQPDSKKIHSPHVSIQYCRTIPKVYRN